MSRHKERIRIGHLLSSYFIYDLKIFIADPIYFMGFPYKQDLGIKGIKLNFGSEGRSSRFLLVVKNLGAGGS